MDKVKREVVRFLKSYQMDHLDVDIDANVESFLDEMKRGLEGKKSSLVMIPTYIETGAEVPSNKRVIVVDAGGTNFRVATVYFDDQKRPVIENLKLFKMPGIGQEVGKDEFFTIMAGYLKEVAAISDRIGFCFSYAVDMQPNKDGRLIRFSKEVKAPGVIGQLIGENLNKALAAAGLGGNKHMVLLNDTVVTLLAGCGYKNRSFGSYVGFILGTGTNCCYIEQNSRITKNKTLDSSRNMIINTGAQKLEKMISGAYLGPLCLHVMKKACKEKLLSPAAAQAVLQISELDTKDLNYFMLYPFGDNILANACKNGTSDDTLAMCYLSDRLIERAAKLTAINLSAMAIGSGKGQTPTQPICIVAEGTTFYHLRNLKPRVDFYLKQYLENKHGVFHEIIGVDNATLIGSAIAGLTN
jgi:hexokinase